jgi:hypothetical protein
MDLQLDCRFMILGNRGAPTGDAALHFHIVGGVAWP